MSIRHAARVARAVAGQDLRLALKERLPLALGLIIPVNFLLLFTLFVLTGGLAPTAVVMADRGPLAERFVDALRNSHSFRIQVESGANADRLLHEGRIVAVITIPASFDADLAQRRPIDLPVEVNNLQVDFTNDIRRAVPLAITAFYSDAFPDQVAVRAHEVDVQVQDTGYIPYLAVSVVVVGFVISGLLQGSLVAAREFEDGTIKELLLSPAPRWALGIGKLAAALILNLASALVVVAIVVLLMGVVPVHPLEVAALGLLFLVCFSAFGVLAGTLLKRRQAAIPLSISIALPLFFVSGPFGPPGWLGTWSALLAAISPVTYGIALFQHGFHGYQTYPAGTTVELAIIAGLAVIAVGANAWNLAHLEVR